METIHIQGGIPLQGKVRIQGSKNAALPILAACLLMEDVSFLRNCPRIADVEAMIELLQCLGCSMHWRREGLEVNTRQFNCGALPEKAVRGMRSSVFLWGALLGRCGEFSLEYPGGCVIGNRPVDMHIWALEQLGARFQQEESRLYAYAPHLSGAYIRLPISSVGVTENIILAALSAQGDTYVEGAAKEPEIIALCDFLNRCGAWIEGAGTEHLHVVGGRRLYGTEYTIPADRIVAGTYLFATIGTGGRVLLEQAPVKHMGETIRVAEDMGAALYLTSEGIYVQGPSRPRSIRLETAPYPGFPTDLQSIVLAVETVGEGRSKITERIFENRFRIVPQLQKMGANIEVEDSICAHVCGVNALKGAHLHGEELRGGAALVIAGLMADGESRVEGVSYIMRGYENICRDFKELGARVSGE